MNDEIKQDSLDKNYTDVIRHAILRFGAQNKLDGKKISEKIGINETLLSKIINGTRDPVFGSVKILKNYAKLYGEDPHNIIRLICEIEGLKIDEELTLKPYVKALANSYEFTNKIVRRAVIHDRMIHFDGGSKNREVWELSNIIFMLLMDLDETKLKSILEIVYLIHKGTDINLNNDAKFCVDQYIDTSIKK